MTWPTPTQRTSVKDGRGEIELNIDELVIRGIPPGDRHRIVQEIEEELTRLLQEGGMPSAAGSPQIKELPEASAKSQKSGKNSVGRQIARSIYQGLGANE